MLIEFKINCAHITKEKVVEEQNGLQKGWSYSAGSFTFKILVEKCKQFNIETHIAFIDFKRPLTE